MASQTKGPYFYLILMYANWKMQHQYQEQLKQQKIDIRNAVYQVFGGFRIDKEFSSEQYQIIDATTGKSCLQFEFTNHDFIQKHYRELQLPHDPKYRDLTVMHITLLSKCGANNGNRLLALVDELAKTVPFIEYITLTDASNIRKCDVRLGLNELSILTSETGESWYNRWGYKSPTHHTINMAHNAVIRNRNMREFLVSVPHLDIMDIMNIMNAFPKINIDGTVHEYVKAISEQIRSFPEEDECDEIQLQKIKALTTLIGALRLEYYKYYLIKPSATFAASRGGNKRRRNKQVKKTVKRRS